MKSFSELLGDGNGPAIVKSRQVTGKIAVEREGEIVVFRAGNSVLRFKYQDAMRIGQWLMQRAYEAKVLADDKKRIET